MEDLTGKELGRYQIVSPLGEGGMASVYKAYQPGMDRYVALKILPRHFASDPKFVGRFDQEAKVVAKLQHPHILPIFDYGENDGYTYIVMPYIKGGTLSAKLQGTPLSHDEMIKIVSQVGDALDYAHANGVLHRDIKPSNIMIDDRGNCMLTDFGIAKMVESTEKFTQTGGIIGTPVYMSPEQGTGEMLDGRSDIYSLGVILYEMATGRPPFTAETPLAVVVKHMHDPLKPPRDINPDISETVERVILKCLAKNRDDRYQSAGDLVDALKPAASTAVRENLEAATQAMEAQTSVFEASEEPFELPDEDELEVETAPMLEELEHPESKTVPELDDAVETAAETVAVLEGEVEPAVETVVDLEDVIEPAAETVAILGDAVEPSAETVAVLDKADELAAQTVAVSKESTQPKPRKKGMKWVFIGGIGLVVIAAAVLIGVFVLGGNRQPFPDTAEEDPLGDFEVVSVEDLETLEPSPIPVKEEPEEEVAVPVEEVYLRLWTSENVGAGLDYMMSLTEAFTAEHPDVTIEVIGMDGYGMAEEFWMANSAEDTPELLYTWNDNILPFYEEGFIQPVEPYFDLSGFVPVSELQRDGLTWGVPVSVGNHLMLIYNREMLPEPPGTVEELIAMGERFNADEFLLVYTMGEPYWLIPWLTGYGGAVFSENGVTLNTQAMIDALYFLHDLKFAHGIVPEWTNYDEAESFFMEGRAAMIINGDWSLLQYREHFGERLGIAPLPVTPVGWPASYNAGDSFLLPANLEGAELDAALAFIHFTLEHGNQLRMAETLLVLPSTWEAFEDPHIREHPLLSISAAQYQRGVPIPIGDEMNCVWQTMRAELDAVLSGAISPEAAAETMQVGAENCIEEFRNQN